MTIKRETQTWTKMYDARRIIRFMKEAAKEDRGVLAANMPRTSYGRPTMARLLRECGVPLMSTRPGVWFILTLFPADVQRRLAAEWERRIYENHYAETCRCAMALASSKYTRENAQSMTTAAVTLGDHLGYGLDEVMRDLTPTAMPEDVEALLKV